ncbi:MAG: cysteine--tRNA ligase [marine benthic group bacterium]|nr:cysteine--tRNA ligase [Gemmatimonadota bacterium]
MSLRFYNTLGRKVEAFESLEPGIVRMYTCGPTVYDRAHIGNFRAFVWEDLLRRYLEWKGWEVVQVMNITDVDDRTIRAAVNQGVPLEEITRPVEASFFEDWETLGLESVEHTPRATEHVESMIELVRRLEESEVAYSREGSIYFAVDRFPGYGRLIDLDPGSLKAGTRVEGDEEYSKDDPRDFVLWKGGARESESNVAVWDSPWGPGRPGWHLECSAMAMEYLGESFDIHTGGVDNIFPHHVNEMAQSEAATGRPFARFWLHAAHLLVDGRKMSKSLGNFHTLASLQESGYRPSSIRYLLLSGHHRQQLNFTLEGLEQAARSVGRLREFERRLEASEGGFASEPPADADPVAPADAAGELDDKWRSSFESALDDDLNVADALAATFELVREGNAMLDAAPDGEAAAIARALRPAIASFDRVFGVLALRAREEGAASAELSEWVEARLRARTEARARRQFDEADRIRDEILARGVAIEDTPDGPRWRLASTVD